MRWWILLIGIFLSWGCHPKNSSVIQVPPMIEDTLTWSTPLLLPEPEPTPEPVRITERPATPNELVYPYEPGREYYVEVMPGWPQTLVLEPGEQWTGIQPGERPTVETQGGTQDSAAASPWEVKSTSEQAPLQHIFVLVGKVGPSMGLVITTTKRSYAVTLKAVKQTPIRFVRWQFAATPSAPTPPRPSLFPPPTQRYHIGYGIETSQPEPDWMPRWVGDTGDKLYMLLPVTTLYDVAPMVRGIGPNGPFLLNVRQYKNVLVVEQVPARLEVRLGTGPGAEVVTITRGLLLMIQCPHDPACPQWPPQGRMP